MPQDYGHLANQVDGARNFTCVVCGTNPTGWTWGDLHGEGMCVRCGTPYQILQYEKKNGVDKRLDAPPRLNIKESWIPVLKQYWEETEAFTGLATIMIARDYPECIEGKRKFDEWLDKHPGVIPE